MEEISLPEIYTKMGWSLVWDDYGWVYASHPEMGNTSVGFPSKHRGLKYTIKEIQRIHRNYNIEMEDVNE